MKQRIKNTRILFLLAMVAVLGACDARTAVWGIVSDDNGKPLPRASVRLVAEKNGKVAECNSGRDGSFLVGMTHGPFAGRFTLLVSKPGFLTFRAGVKANTRGQLRVLLNRDPVSKWDTGQKP